jgi:hypothetical protein
MEGKGEIFNARRLMEGEGEVSNARRPMEGKGEVSNARRPMEGEGEVSNARRPKEGERKASFSPFSISPPSNLFRPSSFSFDLTILFYHSSRPLFTHSFFYPRPINYNTPFDVTNPPHICCRFGLVKDSFFFA